MARISKTEQLLRQALLSHVVPAVLGGLHRVSGLAETRIRRSFATVRHVHGSGIEVGAAATPALIPRGAQVRYVDKYDHAALLSDPELAGLNVRAPDIIASAERLEGIADDSQDFVLAFSLLEHVQDVYAALESFCRVVKPGGTIVLSVPDKRRYGPDQARPITPLDHFVRDYREGPAWSLADHFRETGRLRHNLSGDDLEFFVRERVEGDAHTHFHVWDAESFLAMLLQAKQEIQADYETVEFASYGHEVLVVIKVLDRGHTARDQETTLRPTPNESMKVSSSEAR